MPFIENCNLVCLWLFGRNQKTIYSNSNKLSEFKSALLDLSFEVKVLKRSCIYFPNYMCITNPVIMGLYQRTIIFISLACSLAQFCLSAKINTPRVLLPWFPNLNVNFMFEIIEGGCYTW